MHKELEGTQPAPLIPTDPRDISYPLASYSAINGGTKAFPKMLLQAVQGNGLLVSSDCCFISGCLCPYFPPLLKLSLSHPMGFLAFALPIISALVLEGSK